MTTGCADAMLCVWNRLLAIPGCHLPAFELDGDISAFWFRLQCCLLVLVFFVLFLSGAPLVDRLDRADIADSFVVEGNCFSGPGLSGP